MTAGREEPLGAATHLEGFDGLRAIAVLAVAAYHFFLTVAVFTNERTWDIGQQLRVGVWVFFVLSGFLLYRPFARAHARDGSAPPIGDYALARFLRIWPAYAVALVVLASLWHKIPIDDIGSFVVHLTLTQNYTNAEFTKGLNPAWSLVVEVGFYALLPVYAWSVRWAARRLGLWRAEVGGFVLLVVTGFAWQLAMVGTYKLAAFLPAFLPTFALGIGLAVLIAHGRDFGLPALARHAGWCWAGALCIVVIKGLGSGADDFVEGFRFPNQLAYAAIAFLLVVPAVFGDASHRPNRLLRSWPFRSLGTISYGFFLWSVFVISTVQWEWIPRQPAFPGRSAVVALVSFVVTVAIATASWFVVERPALRLKRRRRHVVRPPVGAPSAG